MKKVLNLTNIIALLGVCVLFVSCSHDDDVDESMVLSGQWQGNWGMYYEVENPRTGEIVAFDSYDTDIVFYPQYDYATYGDGYQVDWYEEGPYSRMSYRFTWSISNGIIYMNYPGFPEYNTSIRNYHMNSSRFTGYFSNGTEPFYLHKIADFYDWSYYDDWDYHYWEYDSWSWDGYYYAKTRTEAGDAVQGLPTDSVAKPRIVKIGSRLAEK